MQKEKNNLLIILLCSIIGFLLIAGIVLFFIFRGSIYKTPTATGLNSKATYKAVFLLNGQVYFGNIKSQTDRNIVLENAYYLQINQVEPTDKNSIQSQQISLVRVGDEMYSPKNEIDINYQNVLMIEELKPESQIISAINNYDTTQQLQQTKEQNNK